MAKSKRSVHGGADSHLEIEVSAVRGFASGNISTCNHVPDEAEGYAVYIRNPLAFHVQDYGPDTTDPDRRVSMGEALAAAFTYADGLADHLGCPVHSPLPRPWTFAQFQASGRVCRDLGAAGIDDADGVAGRLYGPDDSGVHIEGPTAGAYSLTIENWTGGGTLEELEKRLYQWALGSGHLDDPAPDAPDADAQAERERLCPSNHWNDGTDTCADCGADLQA